MCSVGNNFRKQIVHINHCAIMSFRSLQPPQTRSIISTTQLKLETLFYHVLKKGISMFLNMPMFFFRL